MATAEAKIQVSEFTNEPLLDYSKPENRSAMEAALKKVASEFGREYPMYIAGQKVITAEKRTSTNPSHPEQVIGIFQTATPEMAAEAVEAANKAFDSWKRVPAERRAECLFRTAKLLRDRKFEMNAWICYEAGKTWPEADADTAETIDFCEYYGREMLRLAGPQPLIPMQGEKNYLVYIPLGVGVVIPPWNFPAAIVAGMTMASLVTGNTVVLKPPAIRRPSPPNLSKSATKQAFQRMSQFLDRSVAPPSAMSSSKHPKTRYIAFTGSKKSACASANSPAKPHPGQIWIKRTVARNGRQGLHHRG